jgi:23S rRNA-/tRNA-specific pseudouridylate synthase
MLSFFFAFSRLNLTFMEIFISFSETMDDWFQQSLHPKVHVIHSDGNRVTALHKPCDVRSMPNEDGKESKNALLHLPYDSKRRCYIFSRGQNFFLLNRLDAPTSGLLIGCFSEELARVIRHIFLQQRVQKEYRALVRYGNIASRGIFRDALQKSLDGNHLRVRTGVGDLAMTKYAVEKEFRVGDTPLLRLKLEPITGRTHQLRVQCALRKLPIIGDKTYGDFALNKKLWSLWPRLCLQSRAIAFRYNFQSREYFFLAEVACEF